MSRRQGEEWAGDRVINEQNQGEEWAEPKPILPLRLEAKYETYEFNFSDSYGRRAV